MSMGRVPVRDVMSAGLILLGTRRRVAAPVVRDRPRAIDRYIDYFGGHVHRPTAPRLTAASHQREIAGVS
jgi:hypothetical protein